jgi:hypothetical protein
LPPGIRRGCNEVKDRLDMGRVHFLGYLSYEVYMAVMQVSTVHVY